MIKKLGITISQGRVGIGGNQEHHKVLEEGTLHDSIQAAPIIKIRLSPTLIPQC